MKKIQLCLLISTALFATACPKYRPNVSFKDNPNSLVTKINNYIGGKRGEYDNALRTDPLDKNHRALGIRNELVEDALPYLDATYFDFITDIQAGRDRQNFIMDLVELGAAASVGITKGERPLQIIGVALTAFRGGRRSADLNFYKDQSTPILISKMDGNRAKVRMTILGREQKEVADYSLGAAVGDLVDYYNAGTLIRAFTELAKDTADLTKKSEDKVLELKGVAITPEATQETRDISDTARRITDTLRDDLKDPAKAPAALTKLQNIIKALEADPDPNLAKALTDAGISSTDKDGVKLRSKLIALKRDAAAKNNTAQVDKINQAIIDNGQ